MTIPEVNTAEPIVGRAPARPVGPRLRVWALRVVFWGAVVSLIGLNAWWAWEARPLPDRKAIEGLIAQNQYEEAGRQLRAQLRQSPHNGEARTMLSRVLTAQNDLRGSAGQLHQVPYWWPTKADALFMEGRFEMASGRAKAAEAAWKASLAVDPFHPTPAEALTGSVTELVKLYSIEERWQEARGLLWWAYRQTNPSERGQILILLVWIELLKPDPEQNGTKLRRFVQAMADDWDARRALARLEMSVGNGPEATRQIKACLQARPDDATTWRDWLTILTKQGDRDGLQAAMAKLPAAADNDAEIWKLKGQLRERTRDWAGAADAYRKAMAIQPADEESLYRLAIVQERLGQRDEAAALRKRTSEMRAAREELRKAYDEYLDILNQPGVASNSLGASINHLASLCETLGWTRLAEAWRSLLPRS
ncbi:MAG TPA: tetratricopeptide repeat protein [Isosphaeraceae bacterium]|jgi:tetratricopeptide (TPR) repeat protein|nr:tetratricopeptide repeat protein [Isosphaeraceae bacterium]